MGTQRLRCNAKARVPAAHGGADTATSPQATCISAHSHWCSWNQDLADQGCGRERRNGLRAHVCGCRTGIGSSGVLDGLPLLAALLSMSGQPSKSALYTMEVLHGAPDRCES